MSDDVEDVEDVEDAEESEMVDEILVDNASETTPPRLANSPTTSILRNESLLISSEINNLLQMFTNGLTGGLPNQIDASNGLLYRLEIPIDYEEQYDSSDNLISRRIIGFPR